MTSTETTVSKESEPLNPQETPETTSASETHNENTTHAHKEIEQVTSSINTPEDNRLWTEHANLLASRGISREFALSHGLVSIDLGNLKSQVAQGAKNPFGTLPLYKGATGILIPYPNTAMDGSPRFRVRSDKTEVTVPGLIDGSDIGETTVTIPRYICQSGVSVIPYIPKEVIALSGDTTKPLFFVEAPLKALALTANGFPAIGLGGVLAGATDKETLSTLGELALAKELDTIKWAGRVVYVTFDAGISDNPAVALGAARLALALQRKEADVRFVIVPYAHPTDTDLDKGQVYFQNDQGPDDFLARKGAAEFQLLVDAALPADPRVRVSLIATQSKREERSARANQQEQAELTAKLLSELVVQAMLQEGGPVLVDQVTLAAKTSGLGRRSIVDASKSFTEQLSRRAGSSAPQWVQRLRRSPGGGVLGSVANALLVLQYDESIKAALGFDELSGEITWRSKAPWMSKVRPFQPVQDEDATLLVTWLDNTYDIRIPIPVAHSVIDARAKELPYHLIRQYLAGIKHDGTERVAGRTGPGWLTTHLGVEDSPYVRAVGRMFLIGAVARIRQPGCKLDTVLILEGEQGKKKSTAVATLFGPEFFSDHLSDITTKDASSDLRGKWVIEWAELDNLSRSESSAVKKYVSRATDDYRPSYGRRNVRVPRQCVFVGTTNMDNYLKDETGNRRFWPVTCLGDINIELLKADRDALWAEAVALYEANEKWWFDASDPVAQEQARQEQAARRVADPWEGAICAALQPKKEKSMDDEMNVIDVDVPAMMEVTVEYVMETILGILPSHQNRSTQMRVGSILRTLGWARARRRSSENWTDRQYIYLNPDHHKDGFRIYVPTFPTSSTSNSISTPKEENNFPLSEVLLLQHPLQGRDVKDGKDLAGNQGALNVPTYVPTSSEEPKVGTLTEVSPPPPQDGWVIATFQDMTVDEVEVDGVPTPRLYVEAQAEDGRELSGFYAGAGRVDLVAKFFQKNTYFKANVKSHQYSDGTGWVIVGLETL